MVHPFAPCCDGVMFDHIAEDGIRAAPCAWRHLVFWTVQETRNDRKARGKRGQLQPLRVAREICLFTARNVAGELCKFISKSYARRGVAVNKLPIGMRFRSTREGIRQMRTSQIAL
jgi:hypothetical protein